MTVTTVYHDLNSRFDNPIEFVLKVNHKVEAFYVYVSYCIYFISMHPTSALSTVMRDMLDIPKAIPRGQVPVADGGGTTKRQPR